jgi:Na+-driven multidrug efflux pump
MGVMGIWIAMMIDWLTRSAAFVGRYLSGRWEHKNFL